MTNKIALENLAVRFRANCPNLVHADTVDLIGRIGGHVAIFYGLWLGQRHLRHVEQKRREFIADQLDTIARHIPSRPVEN